jgi:hypothetical protein
MRRHRPLRPLAAEQDHHTGRLRYRNTGSQQRGDDGQPTERPPAAMTRTAQARIDREPESSLDHCSASVDHCGISVNEAGHLTLKRVKGLSMRLRCAIMGATDVNRRNVLMAAAAALTLQAARAKATLPTVTLWKEDSCACCRAWGEYMEREGFPIALDPARGPAPMRAILGMPSKYASCHTARVLDYAIEGHVPVREIRRLLRERPEAVGLAVPRMPWGSPGMEHPARRDAYDVLLVLSDGRARVYASYGE